MREDDTIVALSTAPGRGAIAIVRVSGPHAHAIAARHTSSWPPEPRIVRLVELVGGDGRLLDSALVVRFDAPESFTGEPMAELFCHGGAVTPALVMEALIRSGARAADRGEFTRRAVLNGKVDLVQAEAIGDLVDAESRAAHRAAIAQLDHGLSERIAALRDAVLELEALVAYDIDFPEEDDGPVPRERVEAAIGTLDEKVSALLATAPAGVLVREGAVTVIAGTPNVGKSSLFNALAGEARAIVTEIPGTTRDALEVVIDGERWPIRLVDTAGIRATDDVVERLGVELSERHIAGASVIVACGDDDESLATVVARVSQLAPTCPVVRVLTKADLRPSRVTASRLQVSAVTGAGLRELVAAVERAIDAGAGGVSLDAPVLTRARHRHGLEYALGEIRSFADLWRKGSVPVTVAASHLRAAAGFLEDITGGVDADEILDRVFRNFCIGK